MRKKETRYNLVFPRGLLKELCARPLVNFMLMADYCLHLLLNGNLVRPHLLIFSSNLLLRNCLFSHIPLELPLAFLAFPIDINLSLHSYYLQNLLLL